MSARATGGSARVGRELGLRRSVEPDRFLGFGGRRGGLPGGRIVFPEGHGVGLSKWNFEASAKRGRRQSIRCKIDLRGIEGVHEHQGLRSSSRTGLRRVGTRANVIVTLRQPVGAAYAGTCSEVPSMHRRMNVLSGLPIGVAMFVACAAAALAAPLNVGSKRFTESYILGEIVKQTAEAAGETTVAHQQGLGNTAIVLNALTSGGIDVYPEYTGTIAKEILKLEAVPALTDLTAALAPMGLAVAVPLGFNNTYALALRADDARAKGITRLSDLKAHPELRLGLSQEFIGRSDGWPGLKQTYDLPFATPQRSRSRAGVRGDCTAPGGCHRHLLDRRQDRQVRLDRPRRRPPLLSALRRRAAVSGGPAATAAENLAGARAARGQHRRRIDAGA